MTNQQIISKRWEQIDDWLDLYLLSYKEVNTETKDNLQNVFDNFNNIEFEKINKNITKTEKNRLDRKLLMWKKNGLFNDVFGYEARKILNRNKVTYSEMLEILIMGYYIEQNIKLEPHNKTLYELVIRTSYNMAIEDIKPKKNKHFNDDLFYIITNIPIFDSTAQQYMKALHLSYAQEIYKQTLNQLQQKRNLNTNNKTYRKLFKKHQNRLISVRGKRRSGGLEDITSTFMNESYLQAGRDYNIERCRFIAQIDGKETTICNQMNNKLFFINNYNTFDRWFGSSERDIVLRRVKIYGLVLGINLPPLNNYFHWCRSTITYLLD